MNLIFHVTKIPDLTLSKYCSGENNGVEGMLVKHNAFLRQWNRKGNLSDCSIHLYYVYSPEKNHGDKLDIYIMVKGERHNLNNVIRMIKASPFAEDYGLTLVADTSFGEMYEFVTGAAAAEYVEESICSDIKRITGFGVESAKQNARLFERSYNKCATLSKRELFIKPGMAKSENEQDFYTFSAWEMNESARLYQMMSMMRNLDKSVMYRVDLYPCDRAAEIREVFAGPIRMIRRRQSELKGDMFNKDFEADRVLKTYEDIAESIESSPHFITNIFTFGNSSGAGDDVEVILDSAGSEALEKGNYSISSFDGNFTWKSFYDERVMLADGESETSMVMGTNGRGVCVCSRKAIKFTANYLSTLLSLEETAPFFRLPALYEDEVVEIRKETAPKAVGREGGLFLGKDSNGYPVYFPLDMLVKHAFISGVPGSGKTNAMHHITSSLWENGIPFLVLEPAKQEYRALANLESMKDLYVFSPNADMTFPLHINPFEFPKGLLLAEHIRRLVSVFEGAFPLDNPMPFLLDTAIEAVYRDNGWTPETRYTDETKLKFPTMGQLYKKLEDELKSTTYSEEIRGNLESALKVRIGSLLRREMGDVFDVPESTIPPERWLEIPAVIELEAMGSGPANFLTLMLCALIRETLKVNPHYAKKHARHVIFIEEAHNLIGPEAEEVTGGEANAKAAATAFIVKMLAEVRALKEGIVIADQLPTVMAPEVIKNTGLKIGLRITSADDRGLLGSTMAANAIQLEEMATFITGEALISYEGLMKPFKMRVHRWCDEMPDSERDKVVNSKNDEDLQKLLSEREAYREVCERSYNITGMKYFREFKRIDALNEAYIEKFKRIEALVLLAKKLEIERLDKIMAGDTSSNEVKSLTAQINALKENIEKEKKSAYYRGVEDYIMEYVKLFVTVKRSKSRWEKLNITNTDNLDALIDMIARSAQNVYFAARSQITSKVTHNEMRRLIKMI